MAENTNPLGEIPGDIAGIKRDWDAKIKKIDEEVLQGNLHPDIGEYLKRQEDEVQIERIQRALVDKILIGEELSREEQEFADKFGL